MNQFSRFSEKLHAELAIVDLESCTYSIGKLNYLIRNLQNLLGEMRDYLISLNSLTMEEEISFFKTVKPEVLGLLLYFNKIHTFELKCPNGSNETMQEYYQRELNSLTYFFDRNIDFYQYYRSNSTHLDEQYFTRPKRTGGLCMDSAYFVMDVDFSTVYDYKIAKIICNEMLRIYLNRKLQTIGKQIIIHKSRLSNPLPDLKWTGNKVSLIELGYSLSATKLVNNGNAELKEIMLALEIIFNIDLTDFYRAYTDIRGRKKDRTKYLNYMIDCLINRMDADDEK